MSTSSTLDPRVLAPAIIPAGTWVVDPEHSELGFQARHAGVAKVRGRFTEYAGELIAQEDGTVTATGVVRAASVTTGVTQRDDHLRSPDFFDVERHPELRYMARAIALDPDGNVTVTGDLELHGVTREVVLTGELNGIGTDDEGATRVGLSLAGELSRAAFGMRFNVALGGGNVLVSDRIRLLLEISAVRQD